MSKHEYYEELSALAAIGQITAEEDKELEAHVSECSSCREAYVDYVRVLHHQLPQVEPRRWNIHDVVSPPSGNGELRERFFARARAEGVDLSEEAEHHRRTRWEILASGFTFRSAMASALVVLITVIASLAGRAYLPAPAVQPDPRISVLDRANENLHNALATLDHAVEVKSAELTRLQQESQISAETVQALQAEVETLRQQARQLSTAIHEAEQEKTGLADANHQKQKLIADLGSQVDKLTIAHADDIAAINGLQAQIKNLNENLQEAAARLEQERQLSAVGQDVRKLMGSRNLHIIDVHDVDGRGRAAKSFGRVFYAEGQSLIFYAFDLPSGKLTPAKYSFQAWGQREAVSQSARNLGTFYVDDDEQQRWVLKVSDPDLLRGIDSVFVTAEARGDVREPRGAKLLYAFLGGQANHP